MSEPTERGHSACRDHDAFERRDDGTFAVTSTVFDAVVTATERDGRVDYDVRIRMPTLSAAVEGDVARVVEEGWFETLELRIADVGGVLRGDHDVAPTVRSTTKEVIVDVTITDVDERRGVDDAAAVVNYVEGTYVQGIVPGYDYTAPVSQLISRARQDAGA
jgi:hypothetical protein